MASPSWSVKEQKWIIDAQDAGRGRKKFTSIKKGPAGARATKKKYDSWLSGIDDPAAIRLDKAIEKFLADVKARCNTEEQVKEGINCEAYILYEKLTRLYFPIKLKKRIVSTISDAEWQSVINNAVPVGVKKLDKTTYYRTDVLSKKYLNDIRGCIILFCRYAKRAGMRDTVPDALYVPKSAPTVGKGILLPEQLKRLLTAPDEPYINAWRLMAVEGFRPGEAYGIKKEDRVGNMLTVHQAINSKGIQTKGKNENALRQFVLCETAVEIIEEQEEIQRKAGIISPWLFATKRGERPHPHTAFHHWQVFAKKNDITVPPYSLRHTFVAMTKKHVPLPWIQSTVGHSDKTDTIEIYGKYTTMSDAEKSATIIEGIFKDYKKAK